MIVTKKHIDSLREKSFMNISVENEKLILEKFGSAIVNNDNDCQYTYTEQDINEQIRKFIR